MPLALFVIPALWGHPAIDADDLIQNFPLRVLAGRQLASGHLPLLDPLTNAGTPLLGGMNAGALYPLTAIFAVVPAIAAWIINLVVVYVTAAAGVFVLSRWHGLGTSPALAAGLTYAYSGAMVGQIVHLGVVQGFSFLPWVVVVLLALSRRLERLERATPARQVAVVALPWALGFAVLWGLTFLTGEPRAIADVELVTLVVVPSVLVLRSSYWLSTWRARLAYLLTLGVGFAWGVGLGLVQLLPGWSFIHFSERATVSYSFFGAGSLPVRWSALLLTPTLFGGNGALGQQGYFANYNLPEVTGYAGVVALVAAAAFLTRLTRRGWRGSERDYTIYVVLGVVGLLATWGNFTPAGHLFRALPLFGSTRLQSRNVVVVDLALSLVLGWWFDRVQRGDATRAGLGRRARWITAAPAAVVALFSLALIAWGPAIIKWIGISNGATSFASRLTLVNAIHVLVALAAFVLVVAALRTRGRLTALAVVLAVDLVAFSGFAATGLIGGPGPREPSRSAAVAVLGSSGRFALIDVAGIHTQEFRALGQPNMNVFTGLASVQGYGSLISTVYDASTGTHPQNMVSACHLGEGTFAQLRLSAVAVASQLLMRRGAATTSSGPSCVAATPSTSARRYFGELALVHSITLEAPDGEAISSSPVRVRLLNASGVAIGAALVARPGHRAVLTLPAPARAAGFVVTAAQPLDIAHALVVTAGVDAGTFTLDGTFQQALDESSWRLETTTGTVAFFRALTVLPEVWLHARQDGRVRSVRDASWGDTWVTVDLRRAERAHPQRGLPAGVASDGA